MALYFMKQMVTAGPFEIIDPGVVRDKLLKLRIIMVEGVSSSDEDVLFNSVNADLIVAGKVMTFVDAGRPEVEFHTMVFERKSKKPVWTSWSNNRGDEGVFFFDWKKIYTVGALASNMARAVVRDMTAFGIIKDPRMLEQQPIGTGPWALINNQRERGWIEH